MRASQAGKLLLYFFDTSLLVYYLFLKIDFNPVPSSFLGSHAPQMLALIDVGQWRVPSNRGRS